jgi:WD40 repeat protein
MLASGARTITIWDISIREQPREVAVLTGHNALTMAADFSPDGKTLATGSLDHSVKLWSMRTHQEVATLRGHTEPVSCVAFSHDGNILASSGEDKTIRLWRAAPVVEFK